MTYLETISRTVPLPVWEVIARLLCAMIIGAIVGTEREYSKHPAGMRTYTLVSLGACTVMITGQLIFQEYSQLGASPDPARLAAQVIAGVGFLGAGTILRDGATVKGLTTAAGIWVVACLGVAVGAGYYFLSLVGATAVVCTLLAFEWLQKKLIRRKHPLWQVTVNTTDISKSIDDLQEAEKRFSLRTDNLQVENTGENNFKLYFRVEFVGRKWENNFQKFWISLNEKPEITVSRVKEWNGK